MTEEAVPTREVTELFAKILLLTRRRGLNWTVPDVREEKVRALFAALDENYYVLLRQVPDFETEAEDSPDQQLEFWKGDKQVFVVDRRNVVSEFLVELLGEDVEYPYSLFQELWNTAHIKALNLDEHLSNIEQLLDSKLKAT